MNQPYALIDPTGENVNPVRPMNEPLWDALFLCDGSADVPSSRALNALEKSGLISVAPVENNSLHKDQLYRVMPFDLKPTVQWSIRALQLKLPALFHGRRQGAHRQ